jgi:rubredoxin
MDLRSCPECGVVLDVRNIEIPPVYDTSGEFIEGNSEWDGEDYVPLFTCPVCKHKSYYRG